MASGLALAMLALIAAPETAAGRQLTIQQICQEFRKLGGHVTSDFARIRGAFQEQDKLGRRRYASKIDPFGSCYVFESNDRHSLRCFLGSGTEPEKATRYFDTLSTLLKDCTSHRVVTNEVTGVPPEQTRTIGYDGGICGQVISRWQFRGMLSAELWNGRAAGCTTSPTNAR
jgi:hypothetical protein